MIKEGLPVYAWRCKCIHVQCASYEIEFGNSRKKRNNSKRLLPIMHNAESVVWIMSVVRVCNPSFHSLVMGIASCVHALASLPLLGRPKLKTLRILYQNISHQPSQACILLFSHAFTYY